MASPFADEKLYRQWFPLCDTDNDGRITGNDAVFFFLEVFSQSASVGESLGVRGFEQARVFG